MADLVVRFKGTFLHNPGVHTGALLVDEADASAVGRWRADHRIAAPRPRLDPATGDHRPTFVLGPEAVRRVEAGGVRDGDEVRACYIASARGGRTQASLVAVTPSNDPDTFAMTAGDEDDEWA